MTEFSYEALGKAVARLNRLKLKADATRDEMLFPDDDKEIKPLPDELVISYNSIVQQMDAQREVIDHYLITAVNLVDEDPS